MILSTYTIFVENYPTEEEALIYHTRSQALVKIDNTLVHKLKNISQCIEQVESRTRAVLFEMGFLVKDAADDQRRLDDFREQMEDYPGGKEFRANILTTYRCNFDCGYCFEENVRRVNEDMTNNVADASFRWLTDYIDKREYRNLHINFYGGEPLLNVPIMKYVAKQFKDWCETQGLGFSFGMTTNGSLAKRKLVDELCELGLREMQITLDGTAEKHDNNRPFVGGHGSFDIIIKNIKDIVDKIQIYVTGNYDKENLPDIPNLLDYLASENILKRLASMKFTPIVPRLGKKDDPQAIELSSCLNFFDEGLFDATLYIKRELLKRGMDPGKSVAPLGCSLISKDVGVTIDPYGDIYKCNSLLGYKEFSVGNVATYGLNRWHREIKNARPGKECEGKCEYSPMCNGGCRFYAYLETKDIKSQCCKGSYFDRMVPELIKLDYERQVEHNLA